MVGILGPDPETGQEWGCKKTDERAISRYGCPSLAFWV
jgi:hypothetical protein